MHRVANERASFARWLELCGAFIPSDLELVCFQHFGNRSWRQVKRCRRFASAKTNVLTNAQILTGDKSNILRVHTIFRLCESPCARNLLIPMWLLAS